MESQNSQLNGTKTHPRGKESPRVPGCVLARHCGEVSITAQPPTLPGNCINALPWARGFSLFGTPHRFQRVFGVRRNVGSDLSCLAIGELYPSVVNWEDFCSVKITDERENHVLFSTYELNSICHCSQIKEFFFPLLQ